MADYPRAPAHVQVFIDALGPELTVKFLLEFGGARLYLASDPAGRSEVEALLGRKRLEALCALRPGETIRVPTARRWLAHVLVRVEGLSKNRIARTLHVSSSAVWKYLREPSDGSSGAVVAPKDTRQLKLF